MFRIVVENLLDNAFKYSQKSASPRVEVGPEQNGFHVRDNGIGIDMAYSDKLFKPFERIATDYIGTGMGLANVKRIVERHGGEIAVLSKPGETTFSVTFA
jgi:signal transduction histidine kinase